MSAQLLIDGLAQLDCDAALASPLQTYLELLQRWNKAYNLTAVRAPDDMVRKHLLDSLAVLPHLPVGDVIDIGTGAGLPGIPLALARPRQRFTLIDSNGKKTRFVQQAIHTLGLRNCVVFHGRIEQWDGCAQVAISRAFASVADFLHSSQHCVASDGCWLALKGRYPQQELADLPASLWRHQSQLLQVPGLDEQRHLITLQRA